MLKNYPDLFTDKWVETGLKQIQQDLINKHFLVSPVREQNGRRIIILNTRNLKLLLP